MANKRSIHHWWRVLRHIKVWHLIVLLLIFGVISIELLRQNNLGMIERRNLVKQADEQGDDVKIQKSLTELQTYVLNHMNTSMGTNGIYLEHTYQRAYDRAVQQGLQDDSASRNLYNQADAECQATFSKTLSFPAYTQCVSEKLAGQSSSDPLANAKVPSVDLYRYNFVSPAWSPDPAGFALLITCLIGLILLGRIVLLWALYAILRSKHQ